MLFVQIDSIDAVKGNTISHATIADSQLADTIYNCGLTVNWSDSLRTFHAGLIFNTTQLSGYDSYIEQYASRGEWLVVLRTKRLAEEDGYDSATIENATQQALANMPMVGHLPVTEHWGGGNWYAVYDRDILNGYRYATQYGQNSNWDNNLAYQELLRVYERAGEPVLGYDPVTMTYCSQYPRYYDEAAETLDSFYKLGGNDAGLWNYIQNNFWTGTMYGYTIGNLQYECEVGFFALVIGNYYVSSGKTIPYFDRVYTDVYNKLLVNGWSSVAWGVPGAIRHAQSNPQLRLQNTLGAIQALQAFVGSSTWQSSFVNLLSGSEPAWQGLIASPLYANGQFRTLTDLLPTSEATTQGMETLFLEGIIPDTGSLAIPLCNEGYETWAADGFPSSLFKYDYANKMIQIPVNAGRLKFQFGTGIAPYTFPSAGVYEVQFDNSWNTVVRASLVEPLPSLFQYVQGNESSPKANPPVADFDWSPSPAVAGEPVTFNASSSLPGWNGTDATPIVQYSWDLGDGTALAGQIVTYNYSEPGNYIVSLNVTDSEGLWNAATQQIQVMKSYLRGPHDIGITNVTLSKTVVGQGFALSVTVVLFNYGTNTESFNVTAYANATSVSTFEKVLIESMNFTAITLTWNTTGCAYDNYTVSAYAWPVPNETDTTDNNLTGGTVYVGIPGDVRGDGRVNILDIIVLSNSYLTRPTSSNWNPNIDINGDGVVNILDAIIMTNHFLQHYP